MSKNGSLGYQMMSALKTIFHPGHSRYMDKKNRRADGLIRGIGTMRSMSADVHQFGRFIRVNWPEIKSLSEVKPEMALAYITELEQRERSSGRIGRGCASIRKLDTAYRKAGIIPKDVLMLLPYKDQGGPGGFHSQSRPCPYTPEQAQAIIDWVSKKDQIIAKHLTLMWKVGLRIREATYLRAQEIDLENGKVNSNLEGNVNRTKGGWPRSVRYLPEHQDFMTRLKNSAGIQPSGHLFARRKGLPDKVRAKVRQACRELRILCLGTKTYRKAFSVENYRRARPHGASDPQALLDTPHKLGHNRAEVTSQSYVPAVERKRKYG